MIPERKNGNTNGFLLYNNSLSESITQHCNKYSQIADNIVLKINNKKLPNNFRQILKVRIG